MFCCFHYMWVLRYTLACCYNAVNICVDERCIYHSSWSGNVQSIQPWFAACKLLQCCLWSATTKVTDYQLWTQNSAWKFEKFCARRLLILHTIFTDSLLVLCAVLDVELSDQKWPSCPICPYDSAQQTGVDFVWQRHRILWTLLSALGPILTHVYLYQYFHIIVLQLFHKRSCWWLIQLLNLFAD